MNYQNLSRCGELNLEKEKPRNFLNLLVYSIITAVLVGGLSLIPAPKERYEEHLSKNRCKEIMVTATMEDEKRSYKGLAKMILNNPKVKLNNPVGIEYLTEKVAGMNNNRPVIAGQKYKILKCEGCE